MAPCSVSSLRDEASSKPQISRMPNRGSEQRGETTPCVTLSIAGSKASAPVTQSSTYASHDDPSRGASTHPYTTSSKVPGTRVLRSSMHTSGIAAISARTDGGTGLGMGPMMSPGLMAVFPGFGTAGPPAQEFRSAEGCDGSGCDGADGVSATVSLESSVGTTSSPPLSFGVNVDEGGGSSGTQATVPSAIIHKTITRPSPASTVIDGTKKFCGCKWNQSGTPEVLRSLLGTPRGKHGYSGASTRIIPGTAGPRLRSTCTRSRSSPLGSADAPACG